VGMFLLVIFVGGSLAFSLRAWASYDEHDCGVTSAHSQGLDDREDTPLVVALIAITLLGSVLPELLRHHSRLSFIQTMVVSLGVLALAQWSAIHFFNRMRGKKRDGRGARPSIPKA
jgi:hypothetical protein